MTVLRLTSNSLSKTWPNAGNSEYPTLLIASSLRSTAMSDNALGADNQQERPGIAVVLFQIANCKLKNANCDMPGILRDYTPGVRHGER